MNPNLIPDRQKLIDTQKDKSRIFFIKEVFKKNKALSGYVVSRRNPSSLRFFPNEVLLNKYVIELALKDVSKMLNDTYVFQVSVINQRNFVIKFLS